MANRGCRGIHACECTSADFAGRCLQSCGHKCADAAAFVSEEAGLHAHGISEELADGRGASWAVKTEREYERDGRGSALGVSALRAILQGIPDALRRAPFRNTQKIAKKHVRRPELNSGSVGLGRRYLIQPEIPKANAKKSGHCGEELAPAVGTVPAGQGVPEGFVPEGFCGVPLVAVLVLAPLADAPPAASVLPFIFSPVGAFDVAALTHGDPVRFALGAVVCVLGVAALVVLAGVEFAGVDNSWVGAGGAVEPSPAALVVIGVGGPMVDAGGAVSAGVAVVAADAGEVAVVEAGAAVVVAGLVLPVEADGCEVVGGAAAEGAAERVVLCAAAQVPKVSTKRTVRKRVVIEPPNGQAEIWDRVFLSLKLMSGGGYPGNAVADGAFGFMRGEEGESHFAPRSVASDKDYDYFWYCVGCGPFSRVSRSHIQPWRV